MKKIILIALLFSSLISCKKESLTGYTEKPRIYFELNKVLFYNTHPGSFAGNLLVDFSPKPSDFVTDTLVMPVKITGPVSDQDRPFDFQIDKGEATEGIDFKILNEKFVIAAGAIDTTVVIVVMRNEGQKKNAVTFTSSLLPNDQFQLGPKEDSTNFASNSTGNNIRIVSLKTTVTDVIQKPSNWDSFLQTYFGQYSEVKYRFIIDVLKVAQIPSTTSARNMNTYKTRLVTALAEYNEAHPEKLKDENGNEITF